MRILNQLNDLVWEGVFYGNSISSICTLLSHVHMIIKFVGVINFNLENTLIPSLVKGNGKFNVDFGYSPKQKE